MGSPAKSRGSITFCVGKNKEGTILIVIFHLCGRLPCEDMPRYFLVCNPQIIPIRYGEITLFRQRRGVPNDCFAPGGRVESSHDKYLVMSQIR
jgi:hypothetical protein